MVPIRSLSQYVCVCRRSSTVYACVGVARPVMRSHFYSIIVCVCER